MKTKKGQEWSKGKETRETNKGVQNLLCDETLNHMASELIVRCDMYTERWKFCLPGSIVLFTSPSSTYFWIYVSA